MYIINLFRNLRGAKKATQAPKKVLQQFRNQIGFFFIQDPSNLQPKDPVPFDLRSRVAFKFPCAGTGVPSVI